MKSSHRVTQIALRGVAALLVALGGLPAGAEQGTKPAAAPSTLHPQASTNSAPALSREQLEKKWGIQIASLRLSAAGYMVDFRYKVLDADKAAPLAKREVKPYLVDVATGARMLVPSTPKLGSLRQTAAKLTPGRIYSAMFSNPAQVVKAGSKVTVVIGDFRAENLVVE